MKRTIDGFVYDTAHARVIASHETGTTHVHRLTTLYRTAEGRYFSVEEQEAHGVNGALLTPLTDMMAQEWLMRHRSADQAGSPAKNGRIYMRVEIDAELLHRIDAEAAAAGLSEQAWVVAAIERALAQPGETIIRPSEDGDLGARDVA